MNRRFAGLVMLCLAVAGALVFVLKTPSKSRLPDSGLSSLVTTPASTPDGAPSVRMTPASTSAAPLIAPAETVSAANAPVSATGVASAGAAKPAPGGLVAPDPDPSGLPPSTVMENTRSVFRAFASRLGGNPVGTNPEITAALNGGNPQQVVFLRAEDGLRINGQGELVDSWGTPYFFHQLSANEMEIHSAGPDRVMWTADDLVIK